MGAREIAQAGEFNPNEAIAAERFDAELKNSFTKTMADRGVSGSDSGRARAFFDAAQTKAKKDLRADFILANPPFNISDWGGGRLREDARWKYGVPPVGNANFAWLQHIIHHLAPKGVAGVVLAAG